MALNRLDFGTTPNPVTGDWALNAAILAKAFQNTYDPLQFVSTNIPQGATFQIGGVIYYGSSDTAITGTPSAYVKLTPNAGDSGATCDAAFVANLTGVTWSKIYNGYYDVSGNLHIFDEILAIADDVISSANTALGLIIADLELTPVFPIGYVYTQYPGKDSPATLNFKGTWTNISATFAGNFFRTEGGNASAFESGQQADTLKSHNHTYDKQNISTTRESLGSGTSTRVLSAVTVTNTSNTGDTETKPVNETFRLWERTA